tara:strand:- start:1013 stop:1219 length:207 start_codon:yes stop_codon:yes gene_type:complete
MQANYPISARETAHKHSNEYRYMQAIKNINQVARVNMGKFSDVAIQQILEITSNIINSEDASKIKNGR